MQINRQDKVAFGMRFADGKTKVLLNRFAKYNKNMAGFIETAKEQKKHG